MPELTDLELLEAVIKTLIENSDFDTVQIFATKHHGGDNTDSIASGTGNFYARKGQVSQWLIDVESDTDFTREEKEDDEADETENI